MLPSMQTETSANKKVGLDRGFTATRGQHDAALGCLWGNVERGPCVSPLAVCCILHCAIPSTPQRRVTAPPPSASSNELTAFEYVEVWPIVRRVGAWGMVVAPAGKARTTGQVTGTFIGWRREGVEVKWGIEGVFPCQDETTSHRTP